MYSIKSRRGQIYLHEGYIYYKNRKYTSKKTNESEFIICKYQTRIFSSLPQVETP